LTLTFVETYKVRNFAASVFLVNLHQAADEKVLLLGGFCMPVVRLSNRYNKANIRCPLLLLVF
jgi:hypothetical protein